MYGVWWSGAEPDVRPAEDGAKGYRSLALHAAGANFNIHKDVYKFLYDKGQGAAKREEVGEVLYNRGLLDGMFTAEAIRTAMGKFGNKPMTGEQVRWGFENLKISADRLKQLGFEGLARPVSVSCGDHSGVHEARIQEWDGKQWKFISDWIEADQKYLGPKVKEAAAKYAKDKNITPVDCGKQS
jgi:branched-chain amino acid transport system substrate-binding protein